MRTRKMTPEELAKFNQIKPLRDRDGRLRKEPVVIYTREERQRRLEKIKQMEG